MEFLKVLVKEVDALLKNQDKSAKVKQDTVDQSITIFGSACDGFGLRNFWCNNWRLIFLRLRQKLIHVALSFLSGNECCKQLFILP